MFEFVFKAILAISAVYIVWYGTGGVERGEERARNNANNLFVEVTGVPEAFKEEELFGTVTTEELLDEE